MRDAPPDAWTARQQRRRERVVDADRPPALSEAQWRRTVVEAAQRLGWDVLFEVPDNLYRLAAEAARNNPRRGRLLPPAAWPDLVLAHDDPPRVLFVELKADRGSVRPEQRTTLARLTAAGLDARVWRPKDWELVVAALGGSA